MSTPILEDGVVEQLTGLRRTAARRMVQAWAAPVFHVTVEVDMTQALRTKQIESTATVTDAILRASARALVAEPRVNVHVGDDSVTRFEKANVGVAVDSPKGLVVPVVHDIGTADLAEISRIRADVVGRARAGGPTRADSTGGPLTRGNRGLLGGGRVDAGLWAPIAEFTLTADHRALDGATAARFLAVLRRELESPSR